ncbi:MAG: NUDIX hydrolase [Phycisphaerales bacterium]
MAQIELIARGISRHRGKVLLCGHATKNYWYLPGGHVEPHESAAAALAREFLEETGLKVTVGPCVAVAEHIFRQGKKHRHEVNLVFHVKHREKDARSLEPEIVFKWCRIDELETLDLRPAVAVDLVKLHPGAVRHFLWNSDQS